jgi:VanZ family protein
LNPAAVARGWLLFPVAVILIATLTPQPGSSNLAQGFFAPPLPGTFISDLLQNVLLYIPLGMVQSLRGRSLLRAGVQAATLSLSTELGQFLVPGRDPVAADIAINALGATAGWAVAWSVPAPIHTVLRTVERWLVQAGRPARHVAARLSLAWAATVSIGIAMTLWFLSPALPEPFYFLVGTPVMDVAQGPLRIGNDGRFGVFRGAIDEVRIYAGALDQDAIRADMATPVSASSRKPDLVAAYDFDSAEPAGVIDAVTGRHALVRGTTWSESGRFGGALVFDGRTSEVMTSLFQGLELRRAMTIEAWVYPSEMQRGSSTIVDGGAFALRASSAELQRAPVVAARLGDNLRVARSRMRIPANTWTHLAAVYDGRAIALLVNGRPQVRLLHWSSHHPFHMSLDHQDLMPGLVASPATVRSLLSGDFALAFTLLCGALEREAAPVFSLVGVQSREVLTVDAAGPELRIRWASRGRDSGFVPVEYRVARGLSGCAPGQTRAVIVRGPLQRLRVEDGQGHVLPGNGPGIGSAWAFLFDSRILPMPIVQALSASYLALLAIPFGFWARLTAATLCGAVLFGGALYVVPIAFAWRSVDSLQLTAIAFGVVLGAGLRSLTDEHRLERLEDDEQVEGK